MGMKGCRLPCTGAHWGQLHGELIERTGSHTVHEHIRRRVHDAADGSFRMGSGEGEFGRVTGVIDWVEDMVPLREVVAMTHESEVQASLRGRSAKGPAGIALEAVMKESEPKHDVLLLLLQLEARIGDTRWPNRDILRSIGSLEWCAGFATGAPTRGVLER